MKNVVVLGSTGTVGLNTLDVIRHNPDRFRVVGLTAATRSQRLLDQCREFSPRFAFLTNPHSNSALAEDVRAGAMAIDVLDSPAALDAELAAPDVEIVMAAIVGGAGLQPTMSAIEAGKNVLLANKEPLVMLGSLMMDRCRKYGATLLPIDSEHNAVFQCLPGAGISGRPNMSGVRKIILTGSGGPFRLTPIEKFPFVTPAEACKHPNWSMGRKISVDSATMMNKGLEFIEARWLFDLDPEQIEIVIHPQSVVHSMVEYTDGSCLAQLGTPDMRIPIAHALGFPDRIESGSSFLDFGGLGRLDFEKPDPDKFPCLQMALDAAGKRDCSAVVLNAANEIAVQAFLDERVGFDQIPLLISRTMAEIVTDPPVSIEQVIAYDVEARNKALSILDLEFEQGPAVLAQPG